MEKTLVYLQTMT